MASKQNDLMLNILANPQFTVEDFLKVGLSAQNTSLEDENTYLNSEIITSNPLFLDENGEFDKVKFHNVYILAALGLNSMNNEPLNFLAVYSKYNVWAPIDLRENEPTFSLTKANNPDRLTKSMLSIGQNGPREFTPQEIALSLKIWDSEKEKWIDSPEDMFSFSKLFNDFAGFFSDNFGSTKVMALYEEDTDTNGKKRGEIGFDENNIEHYKGDYMLNDNGTYYYRTLKDGENIYGKLVLHYSDILTREGSALNSVDFLDSDDIHKSVFGTFVKDASLIGAMFIPWGVGTAIAGATIFQQAAGLGATLGKLALGSDSSTMNWIEGLVEATNPMKTRSEWSLLDYGNTGRNANWTIENLLGMVGDVVGLLRQQRLLFQYAPVIFKGKWGINEKNLKLLEEQYLKELNTITKKTLLSRYNPENVLLYAKAEADIAANNALNASKMVENYMKSYNKFGEELSKAYMTLLTVNDIYGEAKEAGAEDFDAALVTAGYAAMEYYLLSTDIGKWILPELRGERLLNKAMVRALSRDTLKAFRQLGKEAASSEQAKRTYLLRLVDFGKSVARGEFNVGLGKRAAFKDGEGLLKAGFGSLMAGATAEAVEETTEELLADFSRVLYNGLELLQGKESRMAPFENAFDRYAMSFLGGFLGGGISSATFEVNQARKIANMNYDLAMLHLIYKAHNNDLEGIYKILNSEELGNKNLSATKFDKDEEGNVIWKQGDKNDNQDLAVKQLIKRLLDLVVNTLKAHGGKTDDELINAQLLGDLRFRALRNTTTAGLFIQKYNETLTELVKKVNERKSLDSPIVKAENLEGDLKDSKSEELEIRRLQLDLDIEELDKKIQEFNSGVKAPLFMATALIESTPYIAKALMNSTFKVFVEDKTNTKFENVSENELKRLEIEYLNYLKSDKKDDLLLATRGYLIMSNIIKLNYEKAQEIINELIKNPEIGKLLTDISTSLGLLDFTLDSDKWQELFGQWAASNVFKVGGLDITSQIQTLYNTYHENLKNNSDIVENAKLLRLTKELELKEIRAIKELELRDAFNLGELAGGISEETMNNSLAELDKEHKNILSKYDDEISKLEKEREKADESSKQSLNKELDKAIFDISLKLANSLADEILKAGFINGAIKNQVIDKLINMSRTLESSLKKAEEVFYDGVGKDLESGVDVPNFKDLLKESPEDAFTFIVNNKELHLKEFEQILKYLQAKLELDSKVKKIEELSYTPIMDNLDLFAINVGKAKISSLLNHLGKLLSTARQNVSTFTVEDNVYKQIKEAERVVDLYLATLEGARVDNIDPIRVGVDLQGNTGDTSNLWGINKVLNEVHAKSPKIENDTWEDLPEIEGFSADMMIEDVRRIKRILNSYKTLYSINQGQKLNVQTRVSNKTVCVIYSKLNRLLANVEFPDKDKFISKLNELSLLRELTSSKDPSEWRTSLSKEEQIKLEKERILMEDAIFDYFSDKLDDINKLKEIFNPKNFNMSDSSATLLNEGTEDINDSSFIGYLAAKASLKTSSFLKNFKEILKDGKIAPIISLEIGVLLGLANILNGESVSNIIKAWRSSLLEMSNEERVKFLEKAGMSPETIEAYSTDAGFKLFINDDLVPLYDNIIFIEGIAGSGKTGGVIALINKYLKRFNSDLNIWVSHGGDNQEGKITRELASNIEIENPDEVSFDKNLLLSKIFDDYIAPKPNSKGHLEYNKEAYEIDVNGKIQPKWKAKKDVIAPKIIFIDELLQFTQLELLALDKWAKENGVSIIGSGDLNQSLMLAEVDMESVVKEINKNKKLLSDSTFNVKLTRNQVLHTPKFGTSMRTANNLKNIGMSNTLAILALGLGTIELHNYEDDKIIAGDKQLNRLDRTEIVRYLDKIIPLLKDKEKINFIYSKADPALKEWLEKQEKYNKHINFQPDSALGLEGNYWIVELLGGNKDTFSQDFYTGQTRGKIFTLMLSPDKVGDINIINIQDSETHEERYSPTAVKKYANDKVAILELVGLENAENISYKPRNTQEFEPVTKADKPVKAPEAKKAEKKARKVDVVEKVKRKTTPAPKKSSALDVLAEDLVNNHLETFTLEDSVTGNVHSSKVIAIGSPFDYRHIVLVDINGTKVPFYVSTGKGGKKNVPTGKWYPFLGLNVRSENSFWVCKGSEEDINNFYGIPILKAIADQLNEKYGDITTTSIDPISGERIPLVNPLDVKDIINLNLIPFSNHTPTVFEDLEKAVGNLTGRLSNVLGTTSINILLDTEEISPERIDEYTDDLELKELEEKLDLENGLQVNGGTEIKYESTPDGESMFSLKNFRYLLFTNSSFEVGGLIDENRKVTPSDIPYRIDGINGIFDPEIKEKEWVALQLEAANNGGKVSLQALEYKLGLLRRLLLSSLDKGTIETKIATNLGIKSDVFVRYAIKTTSFDTDFEKEEFSKLEKNEKEKATHARALVDPLSRSNSVNNRLLVAIIGTDHDIIEIPLINLNNPITIIRRLDEDSPIRIKFEYYYYELQGEDVSPGKRQIYALQKLLENDLIGPDYEGLATLILMYLNNYRNIVFIESDSWTPSQNLTGLGIQFNIDRGVGIYDELDYVQTKEWSSLDELRADPSFARISMPMQLASGNDVIVSEDGTELVRVGNPKHPIVLVSDTDYDHNGLLMRTDKDLEREFIYQQFNDVPKTVLLVYIIPPKFTLIEYLLSLCDFMTGKTKESPLGNQRTAFKVLNALFKASLSNPLELLNCFVAALGEEQGKALYNRTKQTIDELNNYKDEDGKIDIKRLILKLTGTSESWVEGIPLNIPLYKLLQNVLKLLVMPLRVVMETEDDGTIHIYNSYRGSESDFGKFIGNLETLFERSNVSLFYQVKGSKTESHGTFVPLLLDNNGRINDPRLRENTSVRPNGLGFSVTGSISSSAYETTPAFNKILKSLVEKQVHNPSKNGEYISTSDNNRYLGRKYDPTLNKVILVPPYSGFFGSRKSKKSTIKPKSVDSKILNKLKAELRPEIYSSLVSLLNPKTENDHSPELLLQIANIINSLNLNYKALVINGLLRTCENKLFEGANIVIGQSQLNGSNITIPITINGVEYTGTYYNGELSLVDNNPRTITVNNSLSLIDEKFITNNLSRFNELFTYILSKSGEVNIKPIVQDKIQKALNNPKELNKLLKTIVIKDILNNFDLSSYEDILNPNLEIEELDICPIPRKLKFK